jgi:hypothetical protein
MNQYQQRQPTFGKRHATPQKQNTRRKPDKGGEEEGEEEGGGSSRKSTGPKYKID